jgi:hypothetical protein
MCAEARAWNPGRFRLTFAALALSAALVLSVQVGPASAQQAYFGEGAAACLECHESEKIMGILETPHANFDDPLSPAARDQCESCHGPSATHVKFPMQVGNIVFTKHGKTPITERNQACLECHHEGDQSHWGEGPHAQDLSCASCLVIHKSHDPMLVRKNQAQNCAACHELILESSPVPTTHPLSGPDAMYCTECHNPHGPTNLTSCVSCHPQDAPTLAKESAKAQDYHGRALTRKIDCTACHKGFVHSLAAIALGKPSAAP